jgi:hypothetical protein
MSPWVYGGDLALHLSESFTRFRRADLTNDEFRAWYLSAKPVQSNRRADERYFHDCVEELPEAIDCRDEGAVAPIKNQGQCGE